MWYGLIEVKAKRDENGRFQPGGPPGPGRPKGFKGVAKQIMAKSRDGAEMVEWAFKVWQDERSPMSDRRWAFEWLSDRGLGKPVARTELEATIERITDNDDRQLTDAQFAAVAVLFAGGDDDNVHAPASGPH